MRAGDYSFAFAGLQVGLEIPTPVGIQVGVGIGLNQLAFSRTGAIDPTVYPNLALPATFWTPSGPQGLAMKGNMYISGSGSVSVDIDGDPIGIELDGAGASLFSYTGGIGYMTTISAAPSINMLGGAINLNLVSGA